MEPFNPRSSEPIAVVSLVKQDKDDKYLATIPYMDRGHVVHPQIYCPTEHTYDLGPYRENIQKKVENLKNTLVDCSRGRVSGKEITTRPYEEIKEIGKTIFKKLGLLDFFKFLFTYANENHNIILLTDEHAFPWEWAYSEEHDKFLCEFKYGKVFPENTSATLERFRLEEGQKNELINAKDRMQYLSNKNIIFFGHDCSDIEDGQHQLHWIEEEMETIKSIFQTKMKSINICQNSELTKYSDVLDTNMSACKILHFSGHIINGDIILGKNRINGKWFTSQGFNLDSHPLVFLNGCSSGDIINIWKKTSDLATAFIKIGASACIVTNMPVSDPIAKDFSAEFYTFLKSDLSYGKALQETRKKIKHALGKYDPTWLFYTLYGDPRQKLVPNVDIRNRMIQGYKTIERDSAIKGKDMLNIFKKND